MCGTNRGYGRLARLALLIATACTLACVAVGHLARGQAAAASEVAGASQTVDFNRDVRPILSAHCFKCHGPDENTREAGVRFDLFTAATAESSTGSRPIVPGHPEQSELIARIDSDDAELRMPPDAANKPLTDRQRGILRAWIAAGAQYDSHWAFVLPAVVAPPAASNETVSNDAWVKTPIDRFVLSRLAAAGLAPNQQADRRTLARRLYLDLLGLPPTPAEVAAFVDDPAADAYERLVDRLLDSPHYGERWARRWLDLARYADTNGYEKDRVRTIWPYRDWVIQAYNSDLPFDQFTIEQLAGDMLPGATTAQRIATGFHRNTMLNEEGGVDPLEFRYHAVVDRVNTTGTVWMGLTVGCAQCHTHKYDPISHHDYYQLMAFLNNADEPEMEVPDPLIAAERERITQQIAAAEAQLAEQFPPADDLRWMQPTVHAVTSAAGAPAEILADNSVRMTGAASETDVYEAVLECELPAIAALELHALTDEQLPQQGPGRAPNGNFVLTSLHVSVIFADGAEERPIVIAQATADFSQQGFPVESALNADAKTGWAVDGATPRNAPRTAVFRFAELVTGAGPLRFKVRLEQQYGGTHTLGRFRLRLAEPVADDRPLAVRRQAHLESQFAAWHAEAARGASDWTLLKPAMATSDVPTLTIQSDHAVLASGDQTKSDTYRLTLENTLERVTALRIEVLPDDSLPRGGPGRIAYEGPFGDFFLSEVGVVASGQPRTLAQASHSFAAGGNTAARAIDGDPQTGWSIDGGQARAHTAVFVLSEPLETQQVIELQLLFERYYAAGLGRFKVWATSAPAPQARSYPTDVEQLLRLDQTQLSEAQSRRLRQYYLSIAPELAAEHQTLASLRKSLPEYPRTLVMQERPATHPRATHLHHRGEFTQPKESVQPQLPALFNTTSAPRDRLEFAHWLVSDENPLVARVAVNRLWAALFGTGLVRTTEDFGYQGDSPTHPELLDYLAGEYRRQGWSQKKLLRQIVTSATYQQSSRTTPNLLAADPRNLLLARFPRVRLDAEFIRDSALRAGGLLSDKLGGPSVFPPQPAGVTSEGAYGPLTWQVSTGSDRYRRGLYTFIKRTAPYAMFSTFDAPSGEACVPRREVSNTPLQALTLLNDGVFAEAAQALGQQAAREADSPAAGIRLVFEHCLSRPPSEFEQQHVAQLQDRWRQRLAAGEIDAVAIAGQDAPDAPQRALWTLTARAILNLDEAFTKE